MTRAACLCVAVIVGCTFLGDPSLEAAGIRVATANLENFGWGGSSCKAAGVQSLSAVLCDYDVVSCQEVMSASEACYGCSGETCHLQMLVEQMRVTSGQDWRYRSGGPWKYGNRNEYYVILYNASIITFLGREGSADLLPGSPAFSIRPPFWASFRCGGFDFTVVDYHAPSEGSSVSTTDELMKVDRFLDVLQVAYADDDDLILAADLNSSRPPLTDHWNLDCGGPYDFIALDPSKTTGEEWSTLCNVDARLEQLGLSNHPVLWTSFSTTSRDDD